MESSTTYDIVSNADTVIVLKNPCIVFAEWGLGVPPIIAGLGKATKELSKKEKKKAKKNKTLIRQDSSSYELVVADRRLASVEMSPADNGGSSSTATVPEENSKEKEQSIFGADPSGTKQTVAVPEMVVPGENRNSIDLSSAIMSATHGTEAVPKTTIEPKEEEGIRFHVCAGNLMSASPWFNRALKKNGWMESTWNPEDRWFHISAEDWDEEAFVILMNVFHLRNHKVPRAITLEMLAKFAVLADYYECGESVDLMVDIWVADLRVKTPVPKTYCRDLILWVWISWTFRLSDLFKEATAVAIQQSPEPLRNLGLPIPAWITSMYILTTSFDINYLQQADEIDLRRNRVIQSILSGLTTQRDAYISPTYTCPINSSYSFQCGSMLLGALMKEMDSANLKSPWPLKPFHDQSFDALCAKVRSMKSETWLHSGYNPHECNLRTAVGSIVELAVVSVEGIGLRDNSA